MYATVVVPLDGSTFGERALPMAVALARRSGAALDLVHVREPAGRGWNAPVADTTLSTRVRSATERLLIGSVAGTVLRGAAVSVLLHGPRVGSVPRPDARTTTVDARIASAR